MGVENSHELQHESVMIHFRKDAVPFVITTEVFHDLLIFWIMRKIPTSKRIRQHHELGPSIKSIWDQTLGTFGSNHEIRAGKCAGGTEFCQNHMRGQPYGLAGEPRVKEEKEEGQNKRRSSEEAPPTPKGRGAVCQPSPGW